MAYSTSLTAYPDLIKCLDAALEKPLGVRLFFESDKARFTFCGRVHSFRYLDRRENAKIYPADHPMWGRSPWDPIQVRGRAPPVMRDGKERWPVDLIKLDGVEFDMEDIESLRDIVPYAGGQE